MKEELIFDDKEKLLNEYLNRGIENIEFKEVAMCLRNFVKLGIDKRKIIYIVKEKLETTSVISIIDYFIENEDKDIMKEFNELGDDIISAKKLDYRSEVISKFITITHPLHSKYEYSNIVNSWRWKSLGSTRELVFMGVFSEEEGRILEQLGQLLSENKNLRSNEIKDLYKEFFKDLDPYNVMFTLP